MHITINGPYHTNHILKIIYWNSILTFSCLADFLFFFQFHVFIIKLHSIFLVPFISIHRVIWVYINYFWISYFMNSIGFNFSQLHKKTFSIFHEWISLIFIEFQSWMYIYFFYFRYVLLFKHDSNIIKQLVFLFVNES